MARATKVKVMLLAYHGGRGYVLQCVAPKFEKFKRSKMI